MKHIVEFIVIFITVVFYSCNNNADKETRYHTNTNDTITLSFYNIKLGDSINKALEYFPTARFIPMDSIEDFIPIRNTNGEIYKGLGITAYVVDTTFIVDHTIREEPYHRNGSPVSDSNLKYSEHRTLFVFYVLDGKVCINELFINTCDTFDEDKFFPDAEWGETCIKMFENKYGECDSILYFNNEEQKSVTLSIHASEKEQESAREYCGTTLNHTEGQAIIWHWKNAELSIQTNYNDFGINGNYFNYFHVCRVIATDLSAFERKNNEMINMEKDEEQRVLYEQEQSDKKLLEKMKKQDI